MKVKKLLAILLILAMSVMLLTACGGDDEDSGKKNTTTENNDGGNDSSEEKEAKEDDKEKLSYALIAAERIAADVDYMMESGSLFLLTFENGTVEMDMYAHAQVDTHEILDAWRVISDYTDGKYTLQSEQYRKNSKDGSLVGKIEDSGRISWTAANIDKELIDYLTSLNRWTVINGSADQQGNDNGQGNGQDNGQGNGNGQGSVLYSDIQGTWHGERQVSAEALYSNPTTQYEQEDAEFVMNLVNLAKEQGYSGNLLATVDCDFRADDMRIDLVYDWSDLFKAMKSVASTEDGMIRFLCIIYDTDETGLTSMLQQQEADLMTYGEMTLTYIEGVFASADTTQSICSYNIDGNKITLESFERSVVMMYNQNNTIDFSMQGLECTLNRQ